MSMSKLKTLLTFFVLLFSSSVVAGDDLTGKQIYCQKLWQGKAEQLGFEFIDQNQVNVILSIHTPEVSRVKLFLAEYETDDFYIQTELNLLSGGKYKINRKNLNIYYYESLIYSNSNSPLENCKISKFENLLEAITLIYEVEVKSINDQNKI